LKKSKGIDVRSSVFARFLAAAALVAFSVGVLVGQTTPQTAPPATVNDGRLSDAEVIKLYERTLQLMEAGGIFLPDLTRASKPLIENSRQTLESLKFLGFRNPQLHYRWLATVRAYLLLADTLPKPVPFPEESLRQFAELREVVNRTEIYFQSQLQQLQIDLRDPDRDNVRRYADDNLKLAAPRAGNPRVVFLGDSITDGWRLNEYFPNKDFLNRGISGQITGQMLGRFLNDVASVRPAAVIILAGTNDIGRGVDIVTIESNLTAICDLADHYKIKVILSSVLPVHDYNLGINPAFEQSKKRSPQVIRTLNDWILSFSQTRGYVYVNYVQPLMDVRTMLTREYSDDGLHPNPAGYRIMAPLALAGIEKALGPAVQVQPQKRRMRLF
jgi:lysophospholipase L1-like esterase